MKKRNFPLVLLVLVLIFALMAAVYVSGRFPTYNDMLNTAFTDCKTFVLSLVEKVTSHTADEQLPVSESVTGVTASEGAVSVAPVMQKDVYEFTDNRYTLASEGKCRWFYESSWPFVTQPLVFNETVITVTAEPAFITLSYETGALLAKEESPVYPAEHAELSGNVLSLSGRDGSIYQFRIEDDLSFTDLRAEQPEKQSRFFLSQLEPDEKAAEFIRTRIREWSADDERELPELQLYTGHINREGDGNFWAEKNPDSDTVFYVFTPDKQGIFQIGLADIHGIWIQANAFVAVFGENGDMKQVSIDYVANKPQIKLHLSDKEMYYIAAGWAKDMYDGKETWLQIAESR